MYRCGPSMLRFSLRRMRADMALLPERRVLSTGIHAGETTSYNDTVGSAYGGTGAKPKVRCQWGLDRYPNRAPPRKPTTSWRRTNLTRSWCCRLDGLEAQVKDTELLGVARKRRFESSRRQIAVSPANAARAHCVGRGTASFLVWSRWPARGVRVPHWSALQIHGPSRRRQPEGGTALF